MSNADNTPLSVKVQALRKPLRKEAIVHWVRPSDAGKIPIRSASRFKASRWLRPLGTRN